MRNPKAPGVVDLESRMVFRPLQSMASGSNMLISAVCGSPLSAARCLCCLIPEIFRFNWLSLSAP